MGLIENLKKRGLKDITDPKKWNVVLEYQTLKKHGLVLEEDEILSFSEQMVYRMTQCPSCAKGPLCNGVETEGCGCDMPDGMVTPSNWCHEKRWLPYMSPEEWEKFKEDKGILFSTIHTTE